LRLIALFMGTEAFAMSHRCRESRSRGRGPSGRKRSAPPSSSPRKRRRSFSQCRVVLQPRRQLEEGAGEDADAPRHFPAQHRGLRALFLLGLPGAGKSTVKRRRLQYGEADISVNRFMRQYPYTSRKEYEEWDRAQSWCTERALEVFENAISRRQGLVFDSAGLDADWLARRIADARSAGYRTELLWVDVPEEIALFRNRNREQERWCPESIVMDWVGKMQGVFEQLRLEADTAERLENWDEHSEELRHAKYDLHFYPAPRTRPPSVRPGSPEYGEPPPGACPPSATPGSRRSFVIGPWKRTDEMARKKRDRLTWMDEKYSGDREHFVSEYVLGVRDVLLELNHYPYKLPPGVEHWTLWSRRSMGHRELCDYVEAWLDAREPHGVVSWNYDDNRGRRTIDIWHVHIYFQGEPGTGPLVGSRRQAAHARSPVQRSPCSV